MFLDCAKKKRKNQNAMVVNNREDSPRSADSNFNGPLSK